MMYNFREKIKKKKKKKNYIFTSKSDLKAILVQVLEQMSTRLINTQKVEIA